MRRSSVAGKKNIEAMGTYRLFNKQDFPGNKERFKRKGGLAKGRVAKRKGEGKGYRSGEFTERKVESSECGGVSPTRYPHGYFDERSAKRLGVRLGKTRGEGEY